MEVIRATVAEPVSLRVVLTEAADRLDKLRDTCLFFTGEMSRKAYEVGRGMIRDAARAVDPWDPALAEAVEAVAEGMRPHFPMLRDYELEFAARKLRGLVETIPDR